MLCEECKSRPASVHVTKIVNSQKVQQYLCKECARAKWEDMGFFMQPHLSVQSLLSGLLSGTEGTQMGTSASAQLRRSNWAAFSEFRRTAFWLRKCYRQFNDELRPIYSGFMETMSTRGKFRSHRRQSTCHCKIDGLRKELRNVGKEDYERAAELRDRIKALQDELASSD